MNRLLTNAPSCPKRSDDAHLDLELGYAYIPTEDIVEHELTAALSAVYHF